MDARVDRGTRPSEHDSRLPGLGFVDRAASRCRNARTVRGCRAVERRTARGQAAPRAFAIWRAFSRYSPLFPIGRIVKAGTKRPLSAEEIAAYDAPFPTRASKVAARIYPSFVPLGDNVAVPDQERAWAALERFDKPFLCCFSDGDPITRGGDALFLGRVPGTAGMPHRTLKGGHFIQEDDPAGFVAAIEAVAAAGRGASAG